MNTKPLLIIGCSASKLETKAPALDLYQGSIFTMLRANIQDLREVFEVVILSAEHSLIHQESAIEPYDTEMFKKTDKKALAQFVDKHSKTCKRLINKLSGNRRAYGFFI